MPDFLPRREELLLCWSENFDRIVHADPGAVGLTQASADEYRALHLAFAAAMKRASEPSTRTQPAVQAKNDCKERLLIRARRLTRIVRGVVSGARLMDLGLRPRKNAVRQVPSPAEAPLVHLSSVDGRAPLLACWGRPTAGVQCTVGTSLTVRLGNAAAPSRKAKPQNASAAILYMHVGEDCPQNAEDWTLYGQTTRTAVTISAGPGTPPGSQVWVVAQWTGTRGQGGPMSRPVSMRIAGNRPAMAAA